MVGFIELKIMDTLDVSICHKNAIRDIAFQILWFITNNCRLHAVDVLTISKFVHWQRPRHPASAVDDLCDIRRRRK